MYKIGQKKKFAVGRSKLEYEIKEIITKDFPIQWKTRYGKCPHCEKDIEKKKDYMLERVYIAQNKEDIMYLADTKKTKDSPNNLLFLLPDKKFKPESDMTDTLKPFSNILKEQ